jgi:alkyl hydroperoxide reductase subunit AhpF
MGTKGYVHFCHGARLVTSSTRPHLIFLKRKDDGVKMNLDYGLALQTTLTSNSYNYDVLVIGGGPAGATTAIYTSRAGLRTLVIDKRFTSSALGITGKIANYPGITVEISGAELLDRI